MSTAAEPQVAPAEPAAPTPARLNQPWRLAVALVELLLAAATVVAAVWLWPRGITTITTVLDDGKQLVSTRYYGNLIAAAIATTMVGALLVVDAIRQVLLAVRARPKKVKPRPAHAQA